MADVKQIILPDGNTYDIKDDSKVLKTGDTMTGELDIATTINNNDYNAVVLHNISGYNAGEIRLRRFNSSGDITRTVFSNALYGISDSDFAYNKMLKTDSAGFIETSNLSESDIITTSGGTMSGVLNANGGIASSALTASQILVSDANKNIVSSGVSSSNALLPRGTATESDFNNITTNGIYWIDSTVTTTNRPVNAHGYLMVFNHNKTGGSTRQQVFYRYSSNVDATSCFMREYVNSAWTSWKSLIDSGNIGSQSVNYATNAGNGISNITRSGTTFTVTKYDGTTFTFTQRDNNTTYSAGTGINLSSTTFSTKDLNGTTRTPICTAYEGNNGINYMGKYSDSENLLVDIYGVGRRNISLWSSDINLKTNIKKYEDDVLPIIAKIQTYSFDFIDSSHGKHTNVGLIAQELKESIPEAIMEVPQSDDENAETLLQIDGNKLIPYLVKAIQELSDEVEELKKKIKTEE